ncbi:conserved hypothetical protein [Coccidioides posadasii str. Silveira]|uniref:Uncharacterized protein n=2 Tax=Coccidioides posadasii TaxID=199306 RepID=E9DBJ3_COCPS|nr:conserved hypothetical protein [Coccidioides posadasii str. Silveira]
MVFQKVLNGMSALINTNPHQGKSTTNTADSKDIIFCWYRRNSFNSVSVDGTIGINPAIGQPVLEPGLVSQVNVFVSVLALEPRDGSIQIGKPTPTKLKANVAGVNDFNVNFDGKLGHVNIVVSTAGREVSRATGVEIFTEPFEGNVD